VTDRLSRGGLRVRSGYIFFDGSSYDYATDVTISVFLILVILGFIGIFVVQSVRIIRTWFKRFLQDRKIAKAFAEKQAEEAKRQKAEADAAEAKRRANRLKNVDIKVDGEDDDGPAPVVVYGTAKSARSAQPQSPPQAPATPSAAGAPDIELSSPAAVAPQTPVGLESPTSSSAAPLVPAAAHSPNGVAAAPFPSMGEDEDAASPQIT
jgi:hypothetical protein